MQLKILIFAWVITFSNFWKILLVVVVSVVVIFLATFFCTAKTALTIFLKFGTKVELDKWWRLPFTPSLGKIGELRKCSFKNWNFNYNSGFWYFHGNGSTDFLWIWNKGRNQQLLISAVYCIFGKIRRVEKIQFSRFLLQTKTRVLLEWPLFLV